MKEIRKLEELINKNVPDGDLQKAMLNELSSIHCNVSDLNYKLNDKDDTINELKRKNINIEVKCQKIKKALLVMIDENFEDYD